MRYAPLFLVLLCAGLALAQKNCVRSGECKSMGPRYYCQKSNCVDNIGTCEQAAATCDDSTVCGCNGVTYPSPCKANSIGTNIRYNGPCRQVVNCSTNLQCKSNQFCTKPSAGCARTGRCDPKPSQCTFEWEQVCGCDGRSYNNRCQASRSGVSVQYPGKCRGNSPGPTNNMPTRVPSGSNPTCNNNNDCRSFGGFCLRPLGRCNGGGTCFRAVNNCTLSRPSPPPTRVPTTRPPPPVLSPVVCGCDGRTYQTACYAYVARTSLRSRGGQCGSMMNEEIEEEVVDDVELEETEPVLHGDEHDEDSM